MLISRRFAGTSALALIMSAQVATADVTAKEVWQNWRQYMEGMGYEVTADEQMSADTLTIADLSMLVGTDDAEGSVRVQMGNLKFTENGDGTVSVSIPPQMPITITAEPEGDSSMTAQIDYSQTGFSMIASGSVEEMTYTYAADALTMELASMEVDGQVVPSSDLDFGVNATGLTGITTMKTGDTSEYVQDAVMKLLSFEFVANDPKGGRGAFKGTMNDLKMTGAGAIPLELDSSDASAMLAAGLSFSGGFEYASGSSEFDVQDPEGSFAGTTSSQGGAIKVALDQSRLDYDVSSRNSAMNIVADQIPFGLSAQIEEVLFKLSTPVSKSDDPQDFSLAATLGNFTMDDTLWNIFDPSGALSREPATIAFELAGAARILIDIMDPQQTAMAESAGKPVGELHALDLNDLQVSAAGAELTGMGGFTFDNTQIVDGMPQPKGSVDLKLVGGNGLLDNLVSMGLLPAEQAQGARMMMGLFSVPSGDDVLTSRIEVNDQGHVLANGQRIK